MSSELGSVGERDGEMISAAERLRYKPGASLLRPGDGSGWLLADDVDP